MSKLVFIFFALLIGLFYIFNLDKSISKKLAIFDMMKQTYINIVDDIINTKDKYFSQALSIEKLKEDVKILQEYKLLYKVSQSKMNTLVSSIKGLKQRPFKVKIARVISYIYLNDFTKVWLDLAKTNNSIEALIFDEYAAGIVINDNGRSKALLNGNEKSNYAVFIGSNNAPGIVHASADKKYLLIKYIPIAFNVSIGDEVITSGKDNIFFEGLKVGKVVSISKFQDMQEVHILPYAKVFKETYFHVYENNYQLTKESYKSNGSPK